MKIVTKLEFTTEEKSVLCDVTNGLEQFCNNTGCIGCPFCLSINQKGSCAAKIFFNNLTDISNATLIFAEYGE